MLQFVFKINVATLPKKLARKGSIDRAGLVSWLGKEFNVQDSRYNYLNEYWDGDYIVVGGRAEDSEVLKVKEVLDYICKYNEDVELQWYKARELEWFEL